MNRKKQIKRPALAKLESFVNQVYLLIGSNRSFNLIKLTQEYGIGHSYGTMLKTCKVIEGKRGSEEFLWIWPTQPNQSLYLMLIEKARVYDKEIRSKSLAAAGLQDDGLFAKSEVDQDLLKIVCAAIPCYLNTSILQKGADMNFDVFDLLINDSIKILTKLKEHGN